MKTTFILICCLILCGCSDLKEKPNPGIFFSSNTDEIQYEDKNLTKAFLLKNQESISILNFFSFYLEKETHCDNIDQYHTGCISGEITFQKEKIKSIEKNAKEAVFHHDIDSTLFYTSIFSTTRPKCQFFMKLIKDENEEFHLFFKKDDVAELGKQRMFQEALNCFSVFSEYQNHKKQKEKNLSDQFKEPK